MLNLSPSSIRFTSHILLECIQLSRPSLAHPPPSPFSLLQQLPMLGLLGIKSILQPEAHFSSEMLGHPAKTSLLFQYEDQNPPVSYRTLADLLCSMLFLSIPLSCLGALEHTLPLVHLDSSSSPAPACLYISQTSNRIRLACPNLPGADFSPIPFFHSLIPFEIVYFFLKLSGGVCSPLWSRRTSQMEEGETAVLWGLKGS